MFDDINAALSVREQLRCVFKALSVFVSQRTVLRVRYKKLKEALSSVEVFEKHYLVSVGSLRPEG